SDAAAALEAAPKDSMARASAEIVREASRKDPPSVGNHGFDHPRGRSLVQCAGGARRYDGVERPVDFQLRNASSSCCCTRSGIGSSASLCTCVSVSRICTVYGRQQSSATTSPLHGC